MADEWTRVDGPGGRTFVFAEAGSGPPLVLWHGFPDTPMGWERTAAELAASGYRAVRPWLRGYHPDTIVDGRGYDALSISEDAVAFLDAIGEREATLAGHDWGASMVYGAASLAPERVRATVTVAIPHPSLLPRDPGTLWGARHFIGLRLPWAEHSVRREDFRYVETIYDRWSPNWSGPERDECVANAKACFADPVCLKGALDHYRAISPRLPKVHSRPADVRGLVVGGTVGIVQAEPFEKTAEALGEGSETLIVSGAGHWPHREGGDEFLESLTGFLAQA